MKHLLSLLVIVLLFLSNARAEDRACIDNLRTRLNELEQVTDLFHVNHGGEYIDKQLAKQQKNAEFAWAEWMQDTRKRLDEYANDVKHTLKKKLSEEALADACKQFNERFSQMKESILTESRKFETLSNASKARHEMAMNAIRNMKA